MTKLAALLTSLVLTVTTTPTADETIATIGAVAPNFELVDLAGATHTLIGYRGRRVVLEWFNPECPFVQWAHTKGPLRELGNEARGDGVVWLAINSSAAGREDAAIDINREVARTYSIDYPILLDGSGIVGRRYQARNTPQVFVIDENGILVYRGGVDNAPLGDSDERPIIPYLEIALASLEQGIAVAIEETPAYGCRVKYAPLPSKR